MRFQVVTLGCKVNQTEGDDIAAALAAAGLEPAGRGQAADVIVVNTCTVTGEADRKSRKAVYQAVKRRAGAGSVVAVTGCYAAVAAEELAAIEGVAVVVGQADKSEVVAKVLSLCSLSASAPVTESRISVLASQAVSPPLVSPPSRGRKDSLRTRAFLKIQDGCNNRCSYCIVPDARGNPTSVPATSALSRAVALVDQGVKEIVLTGINVGKYSGEEYKEYEESEEQEDYKDYKEYKEYKESEEYEEYKEYEESKENKEHKEHRENKEHREHKENKEHKEHGEHKEREDKQQAGLTLAGLIGEILTTPGLARVRLSSIEPEDVSLELIGLFNDGLCPHLHIPLQSGDNRTLKRMGRRYTTGEFQRLVNSVRAACPDAAITTDLIVGFPGETDEEFANTLRFLEQIRPSRVHVFQYSKRPGTPAAEMPGQVAPQVKAARSAAARELADRLAAEYRASQAGREADVLVERVKEGVATGTTENYLSVSFPAAGASPGDIVRRLL